MSQSKATQTTRGRQSPHALGDSKSANDDPLKPTLDEIEAQLEAEGEPLSLAEEIAEEVSSGDVVHEHYESVKQGGDIRIAELQRMSMTQLIEEARQENLTDIAGIKCQDLIFKLLKERVKMNGLMFGEGTLEILPDGFGFLQSRLSLSIVPRRHLRIPQPNSPLRLAHRHNRGRPNSPPQGKRALLRAVARGSHQRRRSKQTLR